MRKCSIHPLEMVIRYHIVLAISSYVDYLIGLRWGLNKKERRSKNRVRPLETLHAIFYMLLFKNLGLILFGFGFGPHTMISPVISGRF